MKKTSLVMKLITATCVICGLFIAAIVVMQTSLFKQALQAQQTERLEMDGNAAQDTLSLYLQQMKSLTINASYLRELRGDLSAEAGREAVVQALEDFADRNAETVHFAFFVDENGRTYSSRQVIYDVLKKTMNYDLPAKIAAASPRGLSVSVSAPYRSSMSTVTAQAFARTVYDANKKALGTVILEADMESVSNWVQKSANMKDSSFLVVGSEHNKLFGVVSFPISPETEDKILRAEAGWHSYQDAGGSYRVFTCRAKDSEWRLALILNETSMYASIEELIMRVMLISLALLVSLCVAIVILTRHFITPLRDLAHVMNGLGDGELTLPKGLNAGRRDEIGDLTNAFQNMLDRIRNLMNTQRAAERARTDAELRALSQQLRPHFLYNALNSIGNLATQGESEKIPGAVSALIHLLAMCTDKTDAMIPLREEIQTVQYYLDIMALRYGPRFDAAYQIPEKLNDCAVPKLILQPLAENAVFHGLHEPVRRGLVEIEAYTEGDVLVLSVMDNGAGIPPEKLERLLNPGEREMDESQEHSTGLRNTHQRIQLYFGAQYGLTVHSLVGAGTRIEARLPARKINGRNQDEGSI